jgi:transposase
MSEAKVHVSVEQRIIIKFLTKEGRKQSEICSRLKRQCGEKTLSNVSVYKWSNAFKKGREAVENEEVIQDVQEWLHWQPKDFFLSGICKLLDCWCKCIRKPGRLC